MGVRSRLGPWLAALVFLAAGCAEEHTLLVNLRTDLVAGTEFDAIRTELVRDAVPLRLDVRTVTMGDDFSDGGRVADLNGLATGDYRVNVRLEQRGDFVAQRALALSLHSRTIVTALVTRDCSGQLCDNGDGIPQSCLGSVCVDPTCEELGEEAAGCGARRCETASDCMSSIACAVGECAEGACFFRPVAGSCAADEWCNPDVGCAAVDDGPAILVNTAADELDGPPSMTELEQAGPTLSLREAITLVNNGHPIRTISFDPAVFPAAGPIQVELADGTDLLPALRRPSATIAGAGLGVQLEAVLPDNAALLRVAANDVTISGLTLTTEGAGRWLAATSSDRLLVRDVTLRYQIPRDNVMAEVTDSSEVTLLGLRVSKTTDTREIGTLRFRGTPGLRIEDVDSTDAVWELSNGEGLTVLDGSFAQVGLRTSRTVRVTAADQAHFSSLAFRGGEYPGLEIDDSSQVTVEDISGRDCANCWTPSNFPFVRVLSGGPVVLRKIETNEYSNHSFELGLGVTSHPPPSVTDVREGTLEGTAAVPDGASVELYVLDLVAQSWVAETTVTDGAFSFDLPGISPADRYRLAVTSAGSTTSLSEIVHTEPSFCLESAPPYFDSFEAGSLEGWTGTGSFEHLRDRVDTYDGAAQVRFTAAATLTSAPISLAGISSPVLHFAVRECCDFPANMDLRIIDSSGSTTYPITMPRSNAIWSSRSIDLSPHAGEDIRIVFDSGAAYETGIDAVTLCDGP